MSTINLIGDILKIATANNWLILEREIKLFHSHISIVTENPLHADVKDNIKRVLYERTPSACFCHLTFARRKHLRYRGWDAGKLK
jgi:hypothetical protein